MSTNNGICIIVLSLLTMSCAEDLKNVVDIQEAAQQVGDVMASVDEVGGSSDGSIAFLEGQRKFITSREKALKTNPVKDLFALFIPLPKAQAVACKDTSFSGCVGGEKTRDLNGCTVGSATFTGAVDLTFSENNCLIDADGDSVERSPDFTVTGRRSATLTVEKQGTYGQRLTRAAVGSFTLSSDGIRRILSASGEVLFDFTTSTTAPIAVTGASRDTRTMNTGTLRVRNNLSSVHCDYSPSNVTWASTCNCATSGTWSGTCSDGKSSAIQITGCGTGSITIGESTETLSFDRCYSTN